MNIGLIGYGKMGKEIEQVAIERGHSIVARLNSNSSEDEWDALNKADVCIDFTTPKAAMANIQYCLENGFILVTGTTGWYHKMEEVKRLQLKYKGGFFWASNFSLGVNLFWQVNRKLAEIMNPHEEYGVSISEIHHSEKKDSPSGTAITTAEDIIKQIDGLNNWKRSTEELSDDDLSIESIRSEDVKGTHIVTYESEVDSISLKHEAHSRKGFALGSVLAAEFMEGKVGFYTMEDMLG